MGNSIIYGTWTKFIQEFTEYFKQNEEIWYENLELLRRYL